MPTSVLIPPDNRLLGWALSDLTLYGGQPTGDITIGRATDDPAARDPSPPVGGTTIAPGGAPAASPESDLAAAETTALLDCADAQGPLPTSAPLSTPVDHTAPAVNDAPPSVPQPVGSGSFLQSAVVTPLQAVEEHGGSTGLSPADGVTTPLGSVANALPETLSHTADATLTATTALADGVTHTADALTGAALDPIGTIDTLVADLGAAELLPTGIDAANLAVSAIDDTPLSAFGGSDPAAGLQTLVGMVADSSGSFDLGHAAAPVSEANTGSILDSLAADEAPSVLLGGEDGYTDHHGADDHDGVHIGGLG